MSMEQSIEKLATAIELLAYAISNNQTPPNLATVPDPEPEMVEGKKLFTPPDTEPEPEKEVKKKTKAEKEAEQVKEATLDDAIEALQKFMEAHGKDATIKLLGKFEVKRLSFLDPSRYQEFIDTAKSMGDA